MPRTPNQGKKSKPRRPSIQHFQKLDKKSKEEDPSSIYPKYKGEMIRYHAIEWLRLKCVQRFYSSLTSPPDNTERANDLKVVEAGNYNWLIGFGKKPKGGWVTYTLPPFAQAKFAAFAIKPGEKGHSRGRIHVSIDPFQPNAVIIQGVLAVKQHFLKSLNKSRSKGGGRKYSLAQLFEALSLYDKYQIRKDTKKKIKQSALCYEAKTFRKTQGEKVISYVRKMIDTAGRYPASVFHEIFG